MRISTTEYFRHVTFRRQQTYCGSHQSGSGGDLTYTALPPSRRETVSELQNTYMEVFINVRNIPNTLGSQSTNEGIEHPKTINKAHIKPEILQAK